MPDYLKSQNLDNKNFNIISIIGAQSSGKSTLLNQVFGCQFEMMNPEKAK